MSKYTAVDIWYLVVDQYMAALEHVYYGFIVIP